LFAQPSCISFNSIQYNQVSIDESVQYGGNQLNFDGSSFTPNARLIKASENLCSASPLLILVHGGGFTVGTPDMMDSLSFRFAKYGYVCASISYRLGWPGGFCPVDSSEAIRAWYRSVQDIRGAIRFFKDNSLAFGIDTNNVFLAGWSAGGYAAIGAAYSDLTTESPSFCSDLGAIDGSLNLGNHSSRFKALATFSSAFLFPNHITEGQKPGIIMFNNALDAYDIPLDCNKWWNYGQCQSSFPSACGITSMQPNLEQNNITTANIVFNYNTSNEFNSHWLHNPVYFPYWEEEVDSMASFFQGFISNEIPLSNINTPIVAIQNYLIPAFTEYQLPFNYDGMLYNIRGALISEVKSGRINTLSPGVYIFNSKLVKIKLIVI
jgi:hypothetical protein